jgi:hypothetical protein
MDEITGQRFGRLIVVSDAGDAMKTPAGVRQYYCRCDCGQMTLATRAALTRWVKKSCGCLRRERVAEANRARRIAAGLPLPLPPPVREEDGWFAFQARVSRVGHDGKIFRVPAPVIRTLADEGWSVRGMLVVALAGWPHFVAKNYTPSTGSATIYVPKRYPIEVGVAHVRVREA